MLSVSLACRLSVGRGVFEKLISPPSMFISTERDGERRCGIRGVDVGDMKLLARERLGLLDGAPLG